MIHLTKLMYLNYIIKKALYVNVMSFIINILTYDASFRDLHL